MRSRSSALARSITWAASKQSYLTAGLMVDRALVDDAFRAYGYFRWVDDYVDVQAQVDEDRRAFVTRQKKIIGALYEGNLPADLSPEEEMIADLICRHRENGSGLRSYITKMIAIMEFDANRRGELISEDELKWYSQALGISVIDAILFFIGNGEEHPQGDGRYSAGIAAHIVHILRDMRADIDDGYVNVPREYLEEHSLDPQDVAHPAFRAWVQSSVDSARKLFAQGRRYLDQLANLRVKIVGNWYSARFDRILDTIEADHYVLRTRYGGTRSPGKWLRMAALASATAFRHLSSRGMMQARNSRNDPPSR